MSYLLENKSNSFFNTKVSLDTVKISVANLPPQEP